MPAPEGAARAGGAGAAARAAAQARRHAENAEVNLALAAWRLMDGRIDWAALPLITEMFGVTDIDHFIARLEAVRDHVARISRNG